MAISSKDILELALKLFSEDELRAMSDQSMAAVERRATWLLEDGVEMTPERVAHHRRTLEMSHLSPALRTLQRGLQD